MPPGGAASWRAALLRRHVQLSGIYSGPDRYVDESAPQRTRDQQRLSRLERDRRRRATMSFSEPALEPALAAYTKAHALGGGVVWMRRVSDLETPVAAMLKLGADKPGSFLLESVQGG